MICPERFSHGALALISAARSRSKLKRWFGKRQRGWFRPRNSLLSGATGRLLLSVGVQVGSLPSAGATCVNPATLVKTTVSISRDFDVEKRKLAPGVAGIAGTGWFLSPQLLVTAAHVSEAMQLSSTQWKDIEISNGNSKTLVPSRIHSLAGPRFDKMALLDLLLPFSGAVSLSVRREPLLPEERVVALAYPKRHLRFARGRFVAYGGEKQFPGAALMEIYEGDDRLVLDHGASGAPVLDCEGRVVAVVSSILTQTLNFGFRSVKVSTAWQTPNVISMPANVISEPAEVLRSASSQTE